MFVIWSPPTPLYQKFPNTDNNKCSLKSLDSVMIPPPPLDFFQTKGDFFNDDFSYQRKLKNLDFSHQTDFFRSLLIHTKKILHTGNTRPSHT